MTENLSTVKETFPRRFYFLLGSQGLSGIGSEMQQIALPLWVYQQTGSTMSTAVAFAIQYVPIVLLAPWVGHIADRFERRRLMITCELVAACLVSVTLLGVQIGFIPLVVVLVGVSRVCNALTMPAMQAITVSIVPQAHRARSASLTTMAFSGSLMVAPLAGTAIAGTIGFQAVLLIDISTFVVAALLLSPLPPVPGTPTTVQCSGPTRSRPTVFRSRASGNSTSSEALPNDICSPRFARSFPRTLAPWVTVTKIALMELLRWPRRPDRPPSGRDRRSVPRWAGEHHRLR